MNYEVSGMSSSAKSFVYIILLLEDTIKRFTINNCLLSVYDFYFIGSFSLFNLNKITI